MIEPAVQRRNVTYNIHIQRGSGEYNKFMLFQAVSRCESLNGMSERSELIPCNNNMIIYLILAFAFSYIYPLYCSYHRVGRLYK